MGKFGNEAGSLGEVVGSLGGGGGVGDLGGGVCFWGGGVGDFLTVLDANEIGTLAERRDNATPSEGEALVRDEMGLTDRRLERVFEDIVIERIGSRNGICSRNPRTPKGIAG